MCERFLLLVRPRLYSRRWRQMEFALPFQQGAEAVTSFYVTSCLVGGRKRYGRRRGSSTARCISRSSTYIRVFTTAVFSFFPYSPMASHFHVRSFNFHFRSNEILKLNRRWNRIGIRLKFSRVTSALSSRDRITSCTSRIISNKKKAITFDRCSLVERSLARVVFLLGRIDLHFGRFVDNPYTIYYYQKSYLFEYSSNRKNYLHNRQRLETTRIQNL